MTLRPVPGGSLDQLRELVDLLAVQRVSMGAAMRSPATTTVATCYDVGGASRSDAEAGARRQPGSAA